LVAITATNSATPSLQGVLGRNRLEQARRAADQAQANAQNLRAQANEAERDAQKSQAKVRELSSSSQPADPTYQPQIQGSANAAAVLNTRHQSMGRLVNLSA